jgi:hypothetical protein
MLHERPALDALRERSPVWLALASWFRLQAMQLSPMPHQGSNADEPGIVRYRASSDSTMSHYPRIDTMRFPDLCQLYPRLLKAQLISQGFGFPSLLDGHGS